MVIWVKRGCYYCELTFFWTALAHFRSTVRAESSDTLVFDSLYEGVLLLGILLTDEPNYFVRFALCWRAYS